MLHSIPKGTPRLVKPDTRKLLDIKQLEDCEAKCKRLTATDRNWWSSFISTEKDYRQRWSDPSDEILQNCKKKEWPLKMLKRFKQLEDTTEGDPDQLQREQNLNDLLRKADRCPSVSYRIYSCISRRPPPLSRSKIEFLIISGKTNEFHINRNFPENVLKTRRIKKSIERKIAR